MWLARPYQLMVFSWLSYLLVLLLVAGALVRRWPLRPWFVALSGLGVGLVLFSLFPNEHSKRIQTQLAVEIATENSWTPSPFLPAALDRQLYHIARSRRSFTEYALRRGSSSNMDAQVQFSSAGDMLRYLPRALQIGFLAPFPGNWFKSGIRSDSFLTRRIAGFEMCFVYLALLSLIAFGGKTLRDPKFWALAYFATAMLLLYGTTVNTVGNLYRMRFPFLMFWVAFGVAYWPDAVARLKHLIKRPIAVGS